MIIFKSGVEFVMLALSMFGLLFWAEGAFGSHGLQDSAISPRAVEVSRPASQPIEGDVLRALLRDAYVTRKLPPGVRVDHPGGEIFEADGRYRRALSRTSVYGTYLVEGDTVCVEGRDFDRTCRQVFAVGDDTYSFVDLRSGTSILMTITHQP